jgi:hypothetical protein
VVPRSIFGKKPLTWRGDIGVTNISKDPRGAAILGMEHNAHPKFVGGAFESDSNHDWNELIIEQSQDSNFKR